MSKQERIRIVLDLISTTALLITSSFLVWTIIHPQQVPIGAAAASPTAAEAVEFTTTKAGPVLGSPTARVAIVEFSDFQCPYCERFAVQTLPQLRRDYIDTGKVQFVYRHSPLEAIHPLAVKAATASHCAQQQGNFWKMHDLIFANQRLLTDAKLTGFGKELQLDTSAFASCLDDVNVAVKLDQDEASRLGLQSTPIFLIGEIQPSGTIKVSRRINGAVGFEVFKGAIDAVLGGS